MTDAKKAKNMKKKHQRRAHLNAAALALPLFAAIASGCSSFYANTGSSTEVGEVLAPVKITEPTTSWNVELLFNLTGARVWTAKDSKVTTHYRNTYTNNHLFGMIERKGVQDFDVVVEPLSTDPCQHATEDAPDASDDEPKPLSPQ